MLGVLLGSMSVFSYGQLSNGEIIPKSNSPYSRFGLGDFVNPYFASQAGLGGLGVAWIDVSMVNPINPASLAYLLNTSMEASVDIKYSSYSYENSKGTTWTGNLNYLSLGFPLQNPINLALDQRRPDFSWGMNLMLQPYTTVGYNVEINGEVSNSDAFTNVLKGTGGTYKLTWGNGWRYKDFSFGINSSYVFGKIVNSRRVSLDLLSLDAYSTEFLDEFSVSGLQFRLGAQYVLKLDKDVTGPSTTISNQRRLIFGAFLTNATSFDARATSFYSRDNFSIRLNEVDTVLYVEDEQLPGRLPLEMGFGVTYEKLNKLRVSAEYQMSQWSNYENAAKPDQLLDSYRAALGVEYIPNLGSYNRYWERMRYRFGFFYGTDPRQSQGVQLEQYGLSMGIGMPLVMPRQTVSFLHIGIELGQFGASELLKENYARVTLGFSLNDNSWFFKRKFN